MTRSRLELAWTVLRSEGLRSVRNRLADHVAESRRRARFSLRRAPLERDERVPVLTLLGTPPAPWLGGVQTQLLTRLEAFEALAEPYALLYPTTRGSFRLEVWRPERASAFIIPAPALPALPALEDPGFAQVILRALELAGASTLHVEHLGALPIAAALGAHAARFKLFISIHDFHLFCPRPHLLEQPEDRFCEYSTDLDRCLACLQANWPVDRPFQAQRRSQASGLLRAATAAIFPSGFLRDRFLDLFPGLAERAVRVIEPATTSAPARCRRPPPQRGSLPRPLHVAFAGGIERHKGSRELESLISALRNVAGPRAYRWTLFGGGDSATLRRLRRIPEVRIWGYYRRGTLPELLRHQAVDVVLLLSIVPEAFGLTLSEARRAGVPVIAFDHGAISQRTKTTGGADLVPLQEGIFGVREHLCRFLEQPEIIAGLASEAVVSPVTSGEQNALALLRLYAGLEVSSSKDELIATR